MLGGDCDTCGPTSNPVKVTRVATANLAKLNAPAKSIVLLGVAAKEAAKAIETFSNTIKEEAAIEPLKNKGGRTKAQKPVEVVDEEIVNESEEND